LLFFAGNYQPATTGFPQKSSAAAGAADNGAAKTLAVPPLFFTVPMRIRSTKKWRRRQNFVRRHM
jgi:hypothetical protein